MHKNQQTYLIVFFWFQDFTLLECTNYKRVWQFKNLNIIFSFSFYRHWYRRHFRYVGSVAAHISQTICARTYGTHVVRGSCFHHHHLIDWHDIILDWYCKSLPIGADFLLVLWIRSVLYIFVAYHLLCWLYGCVGLLWTQKFARNLWIQSFAGIGCNRR
jgi:hypothetical protein